MADDELLTAAQVGALFRVDETSVLRWERAGRLPERVPGTRKWRRADIEKLRGDQTTNRNVY